jgi:hypothetical protein
VIDHIGLLAAKGGVAEHLVQHIERLPSRAAHLLPPNPWFRIASWTTGATRRASVVDPT